MLRQLCDEACNSVFIENSGVAQKWVATPFWSDSIVFNENRITSLIAALTLTLGINGPLRVHSHSAKYGAKTTKIKEKFRFHFHSVWMDFINNPISHEAPGERLSLLCNVCIIFRQMREFFKVEKEDMCQRRDDNVLTTMIDGKLSVHSNVAKTYYPSLHHCYYR